MSRLETSQKSRDSWSKMERTANVAYRQICEDTASETDHFAHLVALEHKLGLAEDPILGLLTPAVDGQDRIALQLTRPIPGDLSGLPQRVIGFIDVGSHGGETDGTLAVLQ